MLSALVSFKVILHFELGSIFLEFQQIVLSFFS